MFSPSLKIEGRSGCRIAIIERQGQVYVRKLSGSSAYNLRLKKQFQKQNVFKQQIEFATPFDTPSIIRYSENGDEDLFWFEMQYIPGQKYSDYFERATISELDQTINLFLTFIEQSLKQSKPQEIEFQVFKNKVETIKAAIDEKQLVNRIFYDTVDYLLRHIPDHPLPVGFCHGDFTLSNAIFSADKIYIIDFLDSFVESPLIDIAKLRQDTRFYWSLILETDMRGHQSNKVRQALHYFDQQIVHYFEKNKYYQTWYPYIEKLNLMRILPYLEKENEIKFIADCLNQ